MPDNALGCPRFRRRISAFLSGTDAGPDLQAHFALCDECLEALTEAALRCPAEVPVPAGFGARTLARMPQPERTVLPYAIVAACLVFAALSAFALHTGLFTESAMWLGELAGRRWVLAAVAAIEITGSAVWLWRTARA